MALGLRGGQKLHHDIAFLLVLAEEEVAGGRNYGLLTIWVNPSQARIPSIEEVVDKLTAWASSGPNRPYALVQLHEGTYHMPLPKEGHLGASYLGRGVRGNSLWVSQPTGGPPTPCHCQPPSHLPHGFEWL